MKNKYQDTTLSRNLICWLIFCFQIKRNHTQEIPPMHKLVLIRHGESTWNLENRFTGWTDVDLTPTGSQARSMASRQWFRDVLWKVLMVHCQRIEDRLFESLPDSQIMTDVEKRFLSQAMEEIQEAQREVYQEAAKELILGDSRES